jgi:hypothetical protein
LRIQLSPFVALRLLLEQLNQVVGVAAINSNSYLARQMLLPSTTALPCHDTAKMILALFGRTRNLSLLRRLSASGSKNFEITAATLGVRRLGAFSQRNGRVEEKRIDTPLPPADPVSALDGGAADDDSDVAPLATLAKKRGPGAWPDKSNIYALSDEQVKEWIAQHKLQPYRARQLRQWVYGSRISSWENFRGFPKEESALLAQQVYKRSKT